LPSETSRIAAVNLLLILSYDSLDSLLWLNNLTKLRPFN
jgi:hypothetical protein